MYRSGSKIRAKCHLLQDLVLVCNEYVQGLTVQMRRLFTLQSPNEDFQFDAEQAVGAHLDTLNLVQGHDACATLLHSVALILPARPP